MISDAPSFLPIDGSPRVTRRIALKGSKMRKRVLQQTFALGTSIMLVGAGGGSGPRYKVRRYHTHPKTDCNLPQGDYSRGTQHPPVTAISYTAVLIRDPNGPVNQTLRSGETLVYFQLKQAVLAADHCSISRVALAIGSDGSWTLSLRADQNAVAAPVGPPLVAVAANTVVPPGIMRGSSPTTKYTAYIKRNTFTVRVRGFAAFQAEDDPNSSPGHPVLFEVQPKPFVVQRGVPSFQQFQSEANDAAILQFFKTIDRVEVELSYQ